MAKRARGIYTRPDSPWIWLWLATAPKGQQKVKTAIPVGATPAERHDNRALALQVYQQRMTALARRKHRTPLEPSDLLFNTYADAYALHTIPTHKGATREREILVHLRAFFGTTPVVDIDPDLVRQYATARQLPNPNGRQTSPSTVNREIGLLKMMMQAAVPKYVEASPLAGMKYLATVPRVRRAISEADEARLLAQCDPVDRALYLVGVDTLVRLGDLLDLERIHKHGVELEIRDPKSGSPYRVPLSPRAEAALDALKHADAFYFAKFRTAIKPSNWRGSVRQRFETLAARCVPPVPFGIDGGWTFHGATRKTGATRHARKGTPLAVVQRLGNWKDPQMLLKVYTEVNQQDLYAAVGRPTVAVTPDPLPKTAKTLKFSKKS